MATLFQDLKIGQHISIRSKEHEFDDWFEAIIEEIMVDKIKVIVRHQPRWSDFTSIWIPKANYNIDPSPLISYTDHPVYAKGAIPPCPRIYNNCIITSTSISDPNPGIYSYIFRFHNLMKYKLIKKLTQCIYIVVELHASQH